jgi:HD-like signal output (HDOD) protein
MTPTLNTVIDRNDLLVTASNLPPLPPSVVELASLVSSPDLDLRRIAEVIALDPALTATVLRHANSAASASRMPVASVNEAVVRIGTTSVLALATSAGLTRRLNEALPEYGLDAGDLWCHAVHSSLAAEVVKTHSRMRVPSEAATAALLHDIGKLVLRRYLSPNILRLIGAAAAADRRLDWEAEAYVLGVHHGEVGGMVLEAWGLPQGIVAGVAHHHRPQGYEAPICFAVALADVMATDLVGGPRSRRADGTFATADDDIHAERREACIEALRLGDVPYQDLLDATSERYEAVAARFGSD